MQIHDSSIADANAAQLASLLESAFQAEIAMRCKRAYRHDLNNGLQGLFAGIDALVRLAQGTKASAVPAERIIDMVRQAVKRHQETLADALDRLIRESPQAEPFDVNAALAELQTFLTNDATRGRVRLRIAQEGTGRMMGDPVRLRLALLGLLVDAIDAMAQGGELSVTSRADAQSIEIEIIDTRSPEPVQWQPDLARQPLYRGLVLSVARRIATDHAGRLETFDRAGAGRALRLTFPALSAP